MHIPADTSQHCASNPASGAISGLFAEQFNGAKQLFSCGTQLPHRFIGLLELFAQFSKGMTHCATLVKVQLPLAAEQSVSTGANEAISGLFAEQFKGAKQLTSCG